MMNTGKTANRPLRVGIIGAGHRSVLYASHAETCPDSMQIVAVADPNDHRRNETAERFHIAKEHCYKSADELVKAHLEMDAVINGTMDRLHVETTLPFIEAGYDVLLEKPICTNKEDLMKLLQATRKHKTKLMICHVLRYAPFYAEIKQRLLNGDIGDIVSIETEENVSYHHMAVGFIRGKWANKEKCGNPMLMSKCCHDLDIICWLKSGVNPTSVSSFGGLYQFKKENAPKGSGTRCLVDCSIEKDCPYSALKNYIEQRLWDSYAWEGIEHLGRDITDEQKIESLKNDNPYGRCVWHCDNNVVDHQTVSIQFEDGTTAAHALNTATAKPCRTIHICGTKGEILGVMEDSFFLLRKPDARAGHEYSEERVETKGESHMHGGGDFRLVEDFLRVLNGEAASISTTSIEDSINGHMVAFAADEAMLEKKIVHCMLNTANQ